MIRIVDPRIKDNVCGGSYEKKSTTTGGQMIFNNSVI